MVTQKADRESSGFADWAVVAVVVVALVFGVAMAQRFGKDPRITASPLIGTPVVDVEVPYLERPGSFSMADHLGEIVVVNFWAAWCVPCRWEHPALLQTAAAYEEFGVTFIGVNYQDSTQAAVAFLDDLGRSPETIYGRDRGSRVALEFGVLGMPETFFVDRDGILVGKISGPTNAGLLAQNLDKILLGQAIESVKTGEVQNRE